MKRQDKLNEAWCKYMGKFSTEIMQALAFALRWADEHPHWISVEDELPPCNVFVLTCDEQENENLLMLGGNGRWYDKAVGFHRNITHWMPMPEAPHHIIDANKKVDRVIGTADHIKTALYVLNKKGGLE